MLVEVILFSATIFGFIWYIKNQQNFFKNLNIEYDKTSPFIQLKEMFFRKKNLHDMVEDMYKKCDSSIVGFYELLSPIFMIRHPDLINQILISDFNHFMNHRDFFTGEHNGLLSNNLFSLKGQKWKDMRATLTPAYTGSKLRAMFELIRETAEDFTINLKKEIKDGLSDVEIKDYFTRYANDVIATSAFGFQINSMIEKDNSFLEMSKGVTDFGKFGMFKMIMVMQFQKLSRFFKIRILSKKYTDYYKNLVMGTMKKRFDEQIFRPDMINMLMEARGIDVMGSQDLKVNQKWSDDEIIAQSLMFLFSGFENVSSVLCFLSQELMENQDVQRKLKAEIQEVLKELNGGQLTYEVLNGMKYMDCVVSESMRKWPVNAMTDRVCTKAIEIQDPETGESLHLKAGDKIFIPILGLHRDPKYFPDPMKFDPERFSDENKDSINPNTYLPFGVGPRMCIAHRFAYLEIKAMLFYMFSDLRVDVSEKSTIPLELDPEPAQPYPKNGFWVKLLGDGK
ncbi:hypothetical protein ACFFRR_007495 [Megaselia abdita]